MKYQDYIKNSVISILNIAGFDNIDVEIKKDVYINTSKNKYWVSIIVGSVHQGFIINTDYIGNMEEFTIKNNLTVQATLMNELRKLIILYLKKQDEEK